jgi:peptide/nickel transport system substrate-binding protein
MVENDKVNSIDRYVEDMISNIDDSDPMTVVVYYKKVYPMANRGLFNVYPAHLLEAVYKNNPADINSSSFNQKPTYCGPYMLDAWVPNNYIRLKANPYYFAGRPNFDTVTFWIIPDSNTILANFVAGKLDVSIPGLGIDDPNQADILRKTAGSTFFVQYIAAASVEVLAINFDVSQAGQDVRVRQALLMAIDRNELNRRVFNSFRIPATNIVPINNPFDLKTGLDPYTYNPAKANELLDTAGYKEGADGIRRDPKGNKLHFVISTTTSTVRAREFPVIQAYWKAIGVETEFKPMQSNKFFGDILPKGGYDLAMFSWYEDGGTPINYATWHSSQIPTDANGWIGKNYSRFKDAALDTDLTTTITTIDTAKRTAAFYDAQRITNESLPWIPLTWTTEVRVERKTIGGIDYPTDNGTCQYTWNLRYWWRK